MTEILDKISKWGLAAIVLGYINIYSYFIWFGFSIYPYLETSEIIFSFSSLIIPIAFILGLRLLMMYKENKFKEYEEERAREFIEKLKANPPESKPKRELLDMLVPLIVAPLKWIKWVWLRQGILYVTAIVYAYVSIILLVGIVVSIFVLFSIIRLNDFGWEILFYGFFIIVLMAIYISTLRSESKTKVYTIYSAVILFFILIRSHSSYNSVMDNNPKFKANLLLHDGTWKATNDSILYIGSTRQYYFYHNIKSSENIIVPASTVKEARITELRTGL